MKLVYAILNRHQTFAVNKGGLKDALRAANLSSTGGFLMSGNTTFLICCPDEQVDLVIEVCKKYSKKRKQFVPSSTIMEPDGAASYPVEVAIGGATIFVTDIERFEKV